MLESEVVSREELHCAKEVGATPPDLLEPDLPQITRQKNHNRPLRLKFKNNRTSRRPWSWRGCHLLVYKSIPWQLCPGVLIVVEGVDGMFGGAYSYPLAAQTRSIVLFLTLKYP